MEQGFSNDGRRRRTTVPQVSPPAAVQTKAAARPAALQARCRRAPGGGIGCVPCAHARRLAAAHLTCSTQRQPRPSALTDLSAHQQRCQQPEGRACSRTSHLSEREECTLARPGCSLWQGLSGSTGATQSAANEL